MAFASGSPTSSWKRRLRSYGNGVGRWLFLKQSSDKEINGKPLILVGNPLKTHDFRSISGCISHWNCSGSLPGPKPITNNVFKKFVKKNPTKMKNPTVAGAISTGAALKSHGRWYCRNPYTNSVQTVMRHSYAEIAPAPVGFFIFVGFCLQTF